MVRSVMFFSIKFVTPALLKSQGDKIVARCLEAAGMDEDLASNHNVVMLMYGIVRKTINNYKAHIARNLRHEVKSSGKKLFFKKIYFLQLQCIFFGSTNNFKFAVLQNSRQGNQNNFTPEMLNCMDFFRVGDYNDAEPLVKRAWYYFCTHVLGFVNSNWKNLVKARSLNNLMVTKQVTASDEAYAIFLCKYKLNNCWNSTTELEDNEDDEAITGKSNTATLLEDSVNPGKAQAKEKKNIRDAAIYFNLVKTVTENRKTCTGVMWDVSFKKEFSNPVASHESASVASSLSTRHSSQSHENIEEEKEFDIEEW
jgi:hypothetical protein